MRDWRQSLMPASFRGARFLVEKDELGKVGRSIVRHRYVKSETHATEDMGRLVREYRITAYLASDTADAEKTALITACGRAGVGTLVLPLQGSDQVRCEGCSTATHKDRLGYIALELEFVEAGQDGGGFPALALGDRIVESALDGLGSAVGDALTTFDGVRDLGPP
ncbi:DNA circularization N-terminal domain-containing protein [Methylobacterium frigidaeris]|uniref:DNA circulation N-terminal domain-containing protein n=1 Tax=Methylobacterium frigidaeris TaxID=2038277 RepID=A0AA37HG45_9HYPH|nr:DNA circularization N-terminal domain-containing protein [Methylobacterium frigidaeris]PIK74815.1 hypothetical protein CS379_00515 [Methylobacterium frigidaeris]GJD65177.1 hypothetical protein MPEAHAMD_5364 [Methylobacterium frigidaeris]